MLKLAVGFVVAFAVGAVCRWAGLPAPCPPFLPGALLVVSMTLGYMLVDRALSKPAPPSESAAETRR